MKRPCTLRSHIGPAILLATTLLAPQASAATKKAKPTPAQKVKIAAPARATATPAATPAQNATPAAQAVTKSADNALFDDSFGKLPTNISADNLTLHQQDRVFIYKGNVIVTQGDMTLTSKTLEGTYNEQNQIQRLVAKGDVVITKKDIKATSQQALYDAPSATVTLIDTPQLQQNDSILTADRIKVFLNENRSQAEGTVRVTIANKKDGSPSLLNPAKKTPAAGTPAAAPATPTATATPKK